jgi:hypothetical protein
MGLRIKPFAYFSFPAWECIPYGVATPGHGNQAILLVPEKKGLTKLPVNIIEKINLELRQNEIIGASLAQVWPKFGASLAQSNPLTICIYNYFVIFNNCAKYN